MRKLQDAGIVVGNRSGMRVCDMSAAEKLLGKDI